MNEVEPVVRHMLLCDDVQPDPQNPHKVNVLGLVSTIRSAEEPPFPLRRPEMCAYLQVTGGRGTGEVRVVAVSADSEQAVFASPAYSFSFGADPLAVVGVVFRMRDCVFPEAGLYWLEFRYNGKTIARQPLLVR